MPKLIAHFEADTLADLHAQIEAALYGTNRVPETLPVVGVIVGPPGAQVAVDPPAPPADSVVKTTVTPPAAPAADPAPAAEKKPRGRPRKDQAAAPEAVADEKPAEVSPSPPAQAAEEVKASPPAAASPAAAPLSQEEQETLRAKLRAEAARVQRAMGIGARTEILARICGEDCLVVDEVPGDKLEATLEAFRAAA